jgi:hypothetical protein
MDETYTNRIGIDLRRHRLAANDNETIVEDQVDDDNDVEGHRLAANDSEIVIDGLRRFTDEPDDDLDPAGPTGARER